VSAYHVPGTIAQLLTLAAGVLALGVIATRLRPAAGRALAWALVIVTSIAAERLTAAEPAGVRMVAISAGLLIAFKAVVTVEAQAEGMPPLPAGLWLLFAGLWVGMRPEAFRTVGGPAKSGVGRLIGRALGHMLAGFGLLWLARELRSSDADSSRVMASPVLLAGVCLMFHFGLLTLVAATWRLTGVPAEELHRRPLAARSLTEFWGRRWNLPFAEMTARAVYRPLRRRIGPAAALFASFALSGVLHEAAISVPVRAGYGGPLAYFLLHGGLVLLERRLAAAGCGPEAWGVAGRVWTAAWLVGPLPLLFHKPFLEGVVWPLVG
jgi:alginate O-acetyltransferase complex protein AlgI